MGSFRLKRKTFGFIDNAVHAKGDNWEITKDIFKNEGFGQGLKSMFWRSKDDLQRSVNRMASNGNSDVAKRIVERQNFLGIGGKLKDPSKAPKVTIPSPVQQSQMEMPGPGASASY